MNIFQKLKVLYNKLSDCNIVITLLHEKTLKQSMIDKETDEK